MRLLDDVVVDRQVLLDAQTENLELMRRAVLASETCTALRKFAHLLTPDGLSALPPTTREQLAEWGARPEAPHRITCGDTRLILRSSGSSGRVRTLRHDRLFNERVELLGARGLCCEGLGDNPPVINAMAPGDLFGGYGFVDAVLARRGAAVLPAGTSLPAAHLAELIDDVDVRALVSLPIHIERLQAHIPEALARLAAVYYIGDRMDVTLTDRLAASGTRVRSFAYSTTETGPIGYQCAHLTGAEHHVHEDLVVAEVLDDDHRRLPDGMWGSLAVTVLTTTGAALVRYLVGDHAMLRPSNCPCGSPARILRIGDRDGASTNIDGTVVTKAMFDEALQPAGLPEGGVYQVGVTTRDGLFSLVFRGSALAPVTDQACAAALRKHQTLCILTDSSRFAGLSVEAGEPPRATTRGKVQFFWHERNIDD
ncbi:phenylacetate--CoA ligase family protein [Streptomyces sp. NPDC093261]|uniref:phenylacetate--CoA ligase family protein n=1 Tax=Streptomyces sp. NPDC093261 TaxID=3366037 RepID=UPI00381ACA86